MKNQSQATIDITINYCKDKGISAKPYETDYNAVLTREDKNTIVEMVFEGMRNGDIFIKEESLQKFTTDHKAWKRYAVTLVNDRLRKAKALNGNTTYQYKEPGKLTNSRDEQLKALTQLLEIQQGTEYEADIVEAIEARKTAIAAEKQKEVRVDVSKLPRELAIKLGLLPE